MGFVLSVLYFVTYYLTPATLFGPLEVYRIELILAVLLLLVSVPALMKSFVLKTPQSLAMVGLMFAVILSVLIAVHWAGGAVTAFLEFIPNAFAFFMVCLHCNSKKKLQVLVLMLLFVCMFVIAHGVIDLRHGGVASGPPVSAATGEIDFDLWNMHYPYILLMADGEGGWIYRIRGLGEINDPNDFGQLLVCLIPLMFIFWRTKNSFRNLVLVIFPVGLLLWGVFLTHSRGALVALMAVAVVAARRRSGSLPALLIGGGLVVAAMALNFTGGRAISASSGEDRTALWGESLQLLKSHPLFGVGFGQLTDYLGHTSHNSVAVCAAELGMFGLFFWCLFLFPTVRDILVFASPTKESEGRLVVLSLTGFLVAGWFLSRSFVLTFFLLGGMAEVVFEIALRQGMVAPRMRLGRALPYAGLVAVGLILLMYIMLRIVNLTH